MTLNSQAQADVPGASPLGADLAQSANKNTIEAPHGVDTPSQTASSGHASPAGSRHPQDNQPAMPSRTVNGRDNSQPPGLMPHKHPTFLQRAAAKKGPPGGFDPTPLPDAPPGYTLRFIFHSASNLAPSDIDTGSSDPFLVATLKAANPRRHKEEPDLKHRSPTLRRTTEPVWEDEWIVANVPASGFTLKCRLYDEDSTGADRLGRVDLKVPSLSAEWEGIPPPGRSIKGTKRKIAKRAYLIKGITSIMKHDTHMTPSMRISVEVLGTSAPPHAQMYTLGPPMWIKHYSPMIGRLARTTVDVDDGQSKKERKKNGTSQKYDFQANQIQLSCPVPTILYHRFVEFRPLIASMFQSDGIRGTILNAALHKQHDRVYNFTTRTERGTFDPCTKDAALRFLTLAHFGEGGRVFTYVLTLDGMFRFTETGKEFGIDLLSKHTMHSNVATYIACSGEFLIRRLKHADGSDDINAEETDHHRSEEVSDSPPSHDSDLDPSHFQLVIDNDSGTYRPDKSTLPYLKEFLQKNFPGLGIVTMHWEEEALHELKKAQHEAKNQDGRMVNMVMNYSESSLSSIESDLDDVEEGHGKRGKREAAFEAIADPSKLKDGISNLVGGKHGN